LRLAQDDPHAAVAALAPVLDGSSLLVRQTWLVTAHVLEAVARDALGETGAVDSAMERARYLPTNLTMPEIASELGVSRNTVKTHARDLYAKLGTHRRAEAVDRARALGLLAPSARR
jgi:DNA-binding CsgD family transcriptional regulator